MLLESSTISPRVINYAPRVESLIMLEVINFALSVINYAHSVMNYAPIVNNYAHLSS